MHRAPRRKTRRPLRWRSIGLIVLFLAIFGFGTLAGMVVVISRNLPDVRELSDYQPEGATRIFAADGSVLGSVFKQNRVYVPLSRIPPMVRDAFIANEDHTFYTNPGIDVVGIVRAAIADALHQPLEGASTITQQLARGLFLNDRITITRKIEEALLALKIEHYYTKDQILERYLNLIYLGSGAYGVDAAARTYFGQSVSQLTIGQAAIIAGVVAAPSDYSPFVNLKLARERQRHVLGRMVASGYITRAQARAAFAAPLHLVKERSDGPLGYRAPWFTTYVIARLQRLFGNRAVREGGLQVYTSLDPRMESEAQSAIDWGLRAAKAEGIGAHQAALVAIRPSTGEIVAMIGGKKFSATDQFNRAWQALRQPGSSFKIYLYTAAMNSGLSPSTVMDDTPVTYPMYDGKTWSPHDDDDRFMGPITLRRALALSRNVVAVKLADRIGLDKFIAYAHAMGVRAPLEANLSLALGTSSVSVLDQASGFQTLANQGLHITPRSILMVRDAYGNLVLDDRTAQERRVVSPATAFLMTSMLEDTIAYGTGVNANIGRPAAGKTGTTSDFRDAWFVGYTPDLVTAVWMGNDNDSRMIESYGGNVPARIWARFMRAALAKTPPHPFVVPKGVVKEPTCAGGVDYFLVGNQQRANCGRAKPAPSSAASATPNPDATPPPNTAGDGTNYIPLGSTPLPANTSASTPTSTPEPSASP
uniref:peptidoglycan glycosyltransferase n=1 Tax=mine drainage metagenome TaxID=410659 RepID=E6Q4J9_9ZZZZ